MYYKVVRRLADGRRVSQFVNIDDRDFMMLKYKPNGITEAPKGSDGVYCYDDLNSASELVYGNTILSHTGTVEVHIAYPIGKGTPVPFGTAFPAIKLGRTVAKCKVVNGRKPS